MSERTQKILLHCKYLDDEPPRESTRMASRGQGPA